MMEHSGNENVSPAFSAAFQSMEDFDRECQKREEAERAKNGMLKKVKGPPPVKKQKKKAIDEDALAREKAALEEIGDTNWVGKLNEYRSVNPVKVPGGLTFAESPAKDPVRHTCTLTIAESAKPFGGAHISFSNKKSAKQYAAKQAIDWLVYSNHMPADGTVKFPKLKQVVHQLPPKPGSVASSPSPLPLQSTATSTPTSPGTLAATPPAKPPARSPVKSWASQVPELCLRLGFDNPSYVITKESNTAPFYHGYAHFGNDPRIEGQIGVVQDVYGQKKAKELIAEELVKFLKDIERQRLEDHEAEEKKRKRSSGSSQAEDLIDLAEKTVES